MNLGYRKLAKDSFNPALVLYAKIVFNKGFHISFIATRVKSSPLVL